MPRAHWKRVWEFCVETTHLRAWLCSQFLPLNCQVLGLRDDCRVQDVVWEEKGWI